MNRKELLKTLGLDKAYLRVDQRLLSRLYQVNQKDLQAKKQELNKLLSDNYEIYQEAKPEWKEELQPASIANYLAYQQFYRNSKLPPEINLIIEDQIIAEFSERQKDFYLVIRGVTKAQAELLKSKEKIDKLNEELKSLEESQIKELLNKKPLSSSPKTLLPELTLVPVSGEIIQPSRLEAKTLQPMLKPLATWNIPFISQWSWNR